MQWLYIFFYVYRNDAVDEINDSRSGGKVVDEKKNEKGLRVNYTGK